MKNFIKFSSFGLLFLNAATGFSGAANAQAAGFPRSAREQSFVQNYLLSLRSPNHGVVESAIYHTIWITVRKPGTDISPLLKEIERLETSGHTPSIRYKSLLARYVMKHRELLDELPPAQFESESTYFQALAAHLGTKLLSDPAVAIK